MSQKIRIGIIGVGSVSDYHHFPGLELDCRAELAGICDTDLNLLDQKKNQWQVDFATSDPNQLIENDSIDAIIVATPNFTHKEICLHAAKHGVHIMCEKPLALSANEVREMYHVARDHQIVHMTAFTYRFAPSMLYLKHLLAKGDLGQPRHFRSQRFLDLPETSWGWRQHKHLAGAGDLFDMTIHRIDFAMDLLGPIKSITGGVAQFAPRTRTATGENCEPSDVDDWSALIGEFDSGAVGVWEGTTLAKGYNLRGFGHEWAEINGSEASAVYRMHDPNHLLLGKTGGDLEPVPVPDRFLKPKESPRDPNNGEPGTVFRYDLVWEFVSAICENRSAIPCFYDGLRAQVIADAVLESQQKRTWIDIPHEAR
ncbi:MAG: Gfo/Idh/MocA family oxidoreductase [Planctomycetota bacterium]|nr:Gfo/Idh/MocA family oxidoreductase [Planctomycetota bacterium]